MINYLTIDVEDYYQVSAFEDIISPELWDICESRVENNTKKILNILDKYSVKVTFFVVGWIAEKFPALVREIDKCGHEIGCHSYLHRRIYTLTPGQFREDTQRAKDILENITGKKVHGYRAPSYSITKKSLWALDILEELDFSYDSSIFPIRHDMYGIPDASRFPYVHQNGLKEFPMSTVRILRHNIPVSGGGYFRLFPYWLTKLLLKKINIEEMKPFVFYLHPWEVDPDQPRFRKASLLSKFRHYNNLDKTTLRFENLLKDFQFGPLGVGQ